MIIRKYIVKKLLSVFTVVSSVLLVVFMAIGFAEIMDSALGGKIPQTMVGKALLLQVPFLLSILLPLSFFLAGIITLYNFAENNETTIISASGVEDLQYTKWLSSTAIALTILTTLTTFVLEPFANKVRDNIINNFNKAISISNFDAGKFYPISSGKIVVFAATKSKKSDGFENIFVAERNSTTSKNSWDIYSARHALRNNNASRFFSWDLHNVFKYHFIPGSKGGYLISFEDLKISFPLAEESFIAKNENEKKTFTELWQQKNNSNIAAILFWKFSLSVSILVMSLFIVPFSKKRVRSNKAVVILHAISFYSIYFAMIVSLRYLVALDKVNFVFAVYMLPLFWIVILALTFFINRIRIYGIIK